MRHHFNLCGVWIEFCNTSGGGALMQRTGLLLGIIFSVALGSACSRAADEQDATVNARDSATGEAVDAATGEEITVKGCLTAAPDRAAFVLTADRDALTSDAIYAGTGGTPTYTYELMGNTGDLTAHVGRQVEVTGRLDDERKDDVDVDKKERTDLPEVQSGDRKVEPTIKTETEMDINIRRLQVGRVAPTGQACQQVQGGQ
jgi:hypothetical protein